MLTTAGATRCTARTTGVILSRATIPEDGNTVVSKTGRTKTKNRRKREKQEISFGNKTFFLYNT